MAAIVQSSSVAHKEVKCDDEASKGTMAGRGKDRRDCRDNQKNVTNNGDKNCPTDGIKPAQVGISDVCTEQWCYVCPKRVEGRQTSGGTLTHSESAAFKKMLIIINSILPNTYMFF